MMVMQTATHATTPALTRTYPELEAEREFEKIHQRQIESQAKPPKISIP